MAATVALKRHLDYTTILGMPKLAVFCCMLFGITKANAGAVQGVVADSSGAPLPSAAVELSNPLAGFSRRTSPRTAGAFVFRNFPGRAYQLSISLRALETHSCSLAVRASGPSALR